MPPRPHQIVAPPVRQVTAISDADFAGIREALNNAAFSEDQLNTLRAAAQGRHFRGEQVGSLIDLFSFSEGKVTVVKSLRDSLVDPQHN